MKLVLFIDMDYFFAACEELRHPELKGKSFVVGTATIAKKEKGVVQTCNYEARKFGIRSAMPTMQALKLNPKLVYLESDDKYYEQTSGKVMGMLRGYGFHMEIISIDEAALDIGEMDYDAAERLAKEIKSKVNMELGLPCTIGVSVGKIYAKMICDESKPNGIGILKGSELKEFLKERDIKSLLGVGKKTADRLRALRITTIGQLGKADPNVLVENFGEFGKELFLLANGMDNSKIEENYAALSIGRERTFDRDTNDLQEVESMLNSLCKEVMEELERNKMWFRGISVKARYSDFSERIKNRKLSNYVDSYETLHDTSLHMIKELLKEKRARKIGVRVFELEPKKGQRSLL